MPAKSAWHSANSAAQPTCESELSLHQMSGKTYTCSDAGGCHGVNSATLAFKAGKSAAFVVFHWP